MENDNIKISIDTIKNEFDSFLSTEENSRVFFSGQFGIGKTYFLKDFFKSHESQYEIFHLYPINYQISGNNDVIELLKYDILAELLKKDNEVFNTNKVEGIKESSLLFYSWFKEKYSTSQLLASAISLGEFLSSLSLDPITNSLGKLLGKPMKNLLGMDKEFQKFKEEYKNGEKGNIERYEKAIRTKSISETDYISSLLKEKISLKKKDKKSVLILDDMDRIDPDHIFRILNILSAYFERERENKFGFDLIIFVADYSNLQYIFHHRYGVKTDFPGYIDKFFTIAPYYFDNKKAIIDNVDEIVKNIKKEEPNLATAFDSRGGYIKLFLTHIFMKAVDSEIINLRELLKATRFQLSELKKGSYREDPFEDNFQKLFDKAVKIVIQTFSNTNVFIEKIKLIKQQKIKTKNRMPFGPYIRAMLESLGVVAKKESFDVVWHGYNIKSLDDDVSVLKETRNREEELFYDLLVEYVESKKYLKESYQYEIN